jgi:regulator of protease activity HflC (stomatin/prohibitin superfamily)
MGEIVLSWSFIQTFIIIMGLVFLAYKSIVFVPQGQKYVLERLGKYRKTLDSGANFTIPFIERWQKVDIRVKVLDIPRQKIITKDNAMLDVDAVVFHRVIDPQKSVYEIQDVEKAIEQLTLTNIRSVLGGMTLDESLSERDRINEELFKVVDQATDPWGIKISRIEIKDILPPPSVQEVMSQQLTAERNKRSQILAAEAEKEAEMIKSSGHREAAIMDAEGDKKSSILRAEAELEVISAQARGRKLMAEAEAEATRLLSLQLADGNTQAINYFLGLKYVEALQEIGRAPNQKLVLMPLEASQIIGSLAGISSVFKEITEITTKSPEKLD